jgi:phosphoribosyl 1,2-cyclic phosphodiesterase
MLVTTFASGSTGNCAVVQSGGSAVLLDCGISMRRIKTNLAQLGIAPEELCGILITHEHSDHVSGLRMMTKYFGIPVFAPRTVANRLRWSIAGVEQFLHEITPGEAFSLGGMEITAFRTPHDTPESVGYRIEGDAVFALATDMGCVTDEIYAGLRGAGAVLIEANHDEQLLRYGKYPYDLKRRILSDHGHLSNGDCAVLAQRLCSEGTRTVVLGHLSRENNDPHLARKTVSEALEQFEDITLCVAPEAEAMTLEVLPCLALS